MINGTISRWILRSPSAALAYELDVPVRNYVIGGRGRSPLGLAEGEELLVPTFEVVSNPTIRLSDIRARRFYIVDRAQVRSRDAIMRQEAARPPAFRWMSRKNRSIVRWRISSRG